MSEFSLPPDFQNIESLQELLLTKEESYWIDKGEKQALELFHLMAERVPAYKDFLKKNNIDHNKIKTNKDFKQIPPIDKNNYLRAYPLEMLCWDGKFKEKSWVFSTTSGSTGQPYYFPREDLQDSQYAVIAELYLRSNFEIQNKSTLYINGFAMGAWIGGLFTYQAIKFIAESGKYKLSIITPGIFKEEIIKAVKNIGNKFDQIIIGGYPPLIKDMIEEALKMGVEWNKYNVGFIFSAEGFSESFRDHIIKKADLKNPYKDTLNHYGIVDLGTVAHETPLSILIRRKTTGDAKVYKSIFGNDMKVPTLAQYHPELYYFEHNESSLLCSAFSGLPLVRYDTKDQGGVITFETLSSKLNECGYDIARLIEEVGLQDTVWKLPFVFIYERKDFIVKLYGANIYPETIKKALLSQDLDTYLTGKFSMQIIFDDKQNQSLEINIELKQNVKESETLYKSVENIIVQQLLNENSEYRSNHKESPSRQIPKIIFWPYEHETYFKPGGKQKWTKK